MKEDYNEEPVFYCTECLSLKIRSIDDIDYCDECSSTSIEQIDIYTWENLYQNMYGNKFISNENGREEDTE